MAQRDYYEILGVDRSVSDDDLKKSYRKLAFQFHPDRNPGDSAAEEKFKEAAEAYDVLRDPEKRARYDQFGHAGVNGQGGFGSGGFHSAEDIFNSFGDIFGNFFGFGGNRRNQAQSGDDLQYTVRVSFRDAAKGKEITINIPKQEHCEECKGTGAQPGSKIETCKRCNGMGQVTQSQGFFRVQTACSACRGQGKTIQSPCTKCDGSGTIFVDKKLEINIPAGVDTNSRLRVRGEGEPGINGGPNGDLFILIRVDEDKIFSREGQNLLTTVEISFAQAALGAKIYVETLGDPIEIDVPKGTQNGAILRLKSLGLPFIDRDKKGDLLLELTVETPTKLTKRQEELLKEFAEIEATKETSFFDKAKNIFSSKKG